MQHMGQLITGKNTLHLGRAADMKALINQPVRITNLSTPRSCALRPIPEFFTPPKGACKLRLFSEFIQTIPASNSIAIL
jgi:hypothetical protein